MQYCHLKAEDIWAKCTMVGWVEIWQGCQAPREVINDFGVQLVLVKSKVH